MTLRYFLVYKPGSIQSITICNAFHRLPKYIIFANYFLGLTKNLTLLIYNKLKSPFCGSLVDGLQIRLGEALKVSWRN